MKKTYYKITTIIAITGISLMMAGCEKITSLEDIPQAVSDFKDYVVSSISDSIEDIKAKWNESDVDAPIVVKDAVFTIGSQVCSETDVRILYSSYKKQYSSQFGLNSTEGNSIEGADTVDSYAKIMTLSQLEKIFTLNEVASTIDIKLSAEDKENADKAAKNLLAGMTDEEKSYINANEKQIAELYQRYQLAEKVFDHFAETDNVEISDDEARVMHVKIVKVQQQSTIESIQYMLQNGTDLAKACREITGEDPIDAYVSRDDYSESISNEIFHLRDGEVSDMMFYQGVYFIFKCIDAYDPEKSEENKEKIQQERQTEQIKQICSDSGVDLYSTLNEERWNAISMDDSVNFTSPSFVEVFCEVFQ